jgi:hypothetical protein
MCKASPTKQSAHDNNELFLSRGQRHGHQVRHAGTPRPAETGNGYVEPHYLVADVQIAADEEYSDQYS